MRLQKIQPPREEAAAALATISGGGCSGHPMRGGCGDSASTAWLSLTVMTSGRSSHRVAGGYNEGRPPAAAGGSIWPCTICRRYSWWYSVHAGFLFDEIPLKTSNWYSSACLFYSSASAFSRGFQFFCNSSSLRLSIVVRIFSFNLWDNITIICSNSDVYSWLVIPVLFCFSMPHSPGEKY